MVNSYEGPRQTSTVFLSHNKADKDEARDIALILTVEGINVWFDEWEIGVGDSIVERINNGLLDCTHFAILWSENAARSNWVRREFQSTLAHAIDIGKPRILPIRLDETPLPSLIADIIYLRYTEPIEEQRQKIIKSVTGHLPSVNFEAAIIKMYYQITKNTSIPSCSKCGGIRLQFSEQVYDEKSHGVSYCLDCGNVD